MADYICTEKIYDAKSRLIGYKIKDERGHERSIDTGTLKNAIRTGQINVHNLELTDSNRLNFKPLYIIHRKNLSTEEYLSPGDKISFNEISNKLIINKGGKQKVIDLFLDDDFERFCRPYGWKKKYERFKKVERIYNEELAWYYSNYYYTPYICKFWIDDNVYIEWVVLYDRCVMERVEDKYIVYKGKE